MIQARRGAVLLAIAAALVCGLDRPASAHSGLRFSSPLDGATLGDGPSEVRLTFVEAPEPSLTTVRVVDTSGNVFQTGSPEIAAGDPLSLSVPLRKLGRGIYLVHWRAVSAVDGHASSGVFAFGVLIDPTGAATAPAVDTTTSAIEVAARTTFLAGLMLLLGASAAGLSNIGSQRQPTIMAIAWVVSIVGLATLAAAQVRVTGATISALAGTTIGRALAWRLIALVVAAAAIGVAAYGRRAGHARLVRLGLSGVVLAALGSIIAHSAAGHAAAGRWPVVSTIAIQVAHVAAAGLWLGGLATLVIGLASEPSKSTTVAVRRFSSIAAVGLLMVTASGITRGFQEVSAWSDLITTTYGALIAAKVALLIAIACLGALNRWRNVAKAVADLNPLRRTAAAELAIAMVAVIAAGFLGALPPAASSRAIAGIEASGSDFGTTVRARLTVASDQPGPNRFVVEVDDYDSAEPVIADRVSLRFTPIDDPAVASTSLALAPSGNGLYAGGGAHLSFAGRWRIGVLVERRGNSVEVPLEVETREPPQLVSVLSVPGELPVYTVEVSKIGFVQFALDSDRPGPASLRIACLNIIPETLPIDHIVVTTGTKTVRQWPVTRQDRNYFVAKLDLQPGQNRLAVVARSELGTRMRAVLVLDIPKD